MDRDPHPLRVMIATADPDCRFRARTALQAEPDLCLVAEPSDTSGIVTLTHRFQPNLVLLDAGLATAMNGTASCLSGARIIFVVSAIDREHVLEAVRFGARGIALNTSPTDVFLASVRTVANGGLAFDSDTIAMLVTILREDLFENNAELFQAYGLTSREMEIVAMISTGSTNRQIAQYLCISERTVKHHLTAVFAKLQLSSRLELAMFAVRNHLLSTRAQVIKTSCAPASTPTRSAR